MYYLHLLFDSLQWFLMFFWGYWLFISFFGYGKAKKMRYMSPEKRFLILVPAHNEEKVIGNLVDNLNNLKYPKDLYEVCVIADNCNDKTAEIAKSLGSNVVEHVSPPNEPKGKPYGIRHALDQYGKNLIKDFDAIVIFDADNLVSLNYLEEMNKHLLKGHRLIQCYLDTKNPNDNWITLAYASSYYYMNRSWQLAKSRIGLGNAVGGTGFCVEVGLLQEVGWTAKSLTEDLEFTMQCLLKGEKAYWSHHARIYDEKPESFWASCIQRLRWARGHWDVCFKYTLPLLWRFVSKFDLKAFDGAMYLLNPGKIILGSLTVVFLYISITMNENFNSLLPLPVWFAFLIYNVSYLIGALIVDANTKVKKIKAVFSLVFFNYTYVPLFFWALFTTNNKTWKRTDHSRSIALKEINLGQLEQVAGKEKNE
jgi:cellulose synthase/poly-beta-1,6-N-acetylglucosamine synthase-like glycosyltransferase